MGTVQEPEKTYDEVLLPGAKEPTKIISSVEGQDEDKFATHGAQQFKDSLDDMNSVVPDIDKLDREMAEAPLPGTNETATYIQKAGDSELPADYPLVQNEYAKAHKIVEDDKGRKYLEIKHFNSKRPTRVLVAAQGEEIDQRYLDMLDQQHNVANGLRGDTDSVMSDETPGVFSTLKKAEAASKKEAKEAQITLASAVMNSGPEGYANGDDSDEEPTRENARKDALAAAERNKANAKERAEQGSTQDHGSSIPEKDETPKASAGANIDTTKMRESHGGVIHSGTDVSAKAARPAPAKKASGATKKAAAKDDEK